jgi:hypothetical protein
MRKKGKMFVAAVTMCKCFSREPLRSMGRAQINCLLPNGKGGLSGEILTAHLPLEHLTLKTATQHASLQLKGMDLALSRLRVRRMPRTLQEE